MEFRKLATACILVSLASPMWAQENVTRRLPYEPLPEGKTEIRYTISRSEHSRDEGGVGLNFDTVTSTLFVARGITNRLEIGAGLPYIHSSQRDIELIPGLKITEKRHGPGDPMLHVAYALFTEQERGAAVTLGIRVSPDTSGGSNAFSSEADSVEPFIAIGKSLAASLQGFFRYGYTRRSGNVSDSHQFSAGARQATGERSGLGGSLSYGKFGRSSSDEAFDSWGVSLWGYYRFGGQLYLVPSLSETRYGSHDRIDIPVRVGQGRTRQVALSLSYLF